MSRKETHEDWAGTNWKLTPGEIVEVCSARNGRRRGVIEEVMKDKSGFWLAADGVEPHIFVALEEQSVRVTGAPTDSTFP